MACIRDDFSQSVKKQLASRVGYHCSNPNCRKLTIGPSADEKKSVNIGVAAHISAAAEGGKRYDPALSSDQRKSYNNGIWLCQNCAKLIDSDEMTYTVALLKEWKFTAEEAAAEEIRSVSLMQSGKNIACGSFYYESKQTGRYNNEWQPIRELFSCQTNLIYSEHFTGRTHECNALLKLVEDRSKVLISGMGGIGKTELARWIYQHCLQNDTFHHVGFLTYRDNMDITLLYAFNPPEKLPDEERVAWAWNELHRLVQTDKILLVVDDVNKTVRQDSSLHQLLNLSCAVVLTSRHQTMSGCKTFPLNKLSLEDGIRLFEDIYGPVEDCEKPILSTIVQEMAYCHPLTIKCIASLGKSRNIELPKLCAELETKKFSLAYIADGESVKLAEEYQKLFKIADLSASEIKVLECFSILPYTLLPKKNCITMMQGDTGDKDGMVLDMLAQKNWIEESAGSFAMHPLIAETVRFSHPFQGTDHPALLHDTEKMVAGIEDQVLFMETVPYTAIVLAIADHFFDNSPEESIFLCVMLSNRYYYVTRYNLSCDLLEKTLEITEKTQMWCLHDIVLYYLCMAYMKIGRYQRANEIALSVVVYREYIYEEDPIEIGQAYDVLSGTQLLLGDFEAALQSANRALEYYEDSEESDHDVDLSNLYGNIGGIYLDMGRYEDALCFLEKDVQLKEQSGKVQDIELGAAYNNLADLYMQMQRYELAEKNLLKAMEVSNRLLGEQNQYLGTVLNNLANLCHMQQRNEEALSYICRSIDIQSTEFEMHPHLSASYSSKATILQSLGKTEEALQANDIAYNMVLETLGDVNPTMGMVELTYAFVYFSQTKYSEALPYAKKACEILERFYANNNMYLINAQMILGESLSFTGAYQCALKILKQVEQYTDNDLLSVEHLQTVLNLIRIYTELEQHENALQQCVKALKLCIHNNIAKEIQTFVLDKLLLCYQLSGHSENEVEQWLKKALD